MEQPSILIFGAVFLLAVLSSQAITDNDNVVRVMLDHTSHGSMYRTVTEGQTVILDCSQLLNVYRHGIKGDAEDHIYYWTRGKITMADSPQLTIKAGQSTRGAYRCIAVAPARGEAHIIVLTKTIRLTVETPICSVQGQVFTTCGTKCVPTCANPHPTNCTGSCVAGCQCPDGSVLDEVYNKCVPLNQCECPPTCSHDYCSRPDNAISACNLPTNASHCNVIQCNACYYSEEFIKMPLRCYNKVCNSGTCEKDVCMKKWANCISNRMARRVKCENDCKTFENFHCFQYPTC